MGHVQLSNEVNGTSEEKAITERALSDALKTILKLTGGKMTGNLSIENIAPILELSETDTGEKYFLTADAGAFSIRKSNTADMNYAFKLDKGQAFVFSSKVLTEVMKNIPGGYVGLDNAGKFPVEFVPKKRVASGSWVNQTVSERTIYLGFRPTFIFVRGEQTGYPQNIRGPFVWDTGGIDGTGIQFGGGYQSTAAPILNAITPTDTGFIIRNAAMGSTDTWYWWASE